MAYYRGSLVVGKASAPNPGTGSVVLAAVAGYFNPGTVVPTGSTCHYSLQDVPADTMYEEGYGTITVSAGTATLARTRIISSSNAGAAVNFTGTPYFAVAPCGEEEVDPNLTADPSTTNLAPGTRWFRSDLKDFRGFDGSGAISLASSQQRTINQTAHGFSVGNWLRLSGASTYALAQADSAVNAEVVGVVASVVDANNFTLCTSGYVTGLSGLTASATYFLSPTAAGALTATEPVTAGQIDKPVLVADTTTSGYFFNFRGMIVSGAGVSGYDMLSSFVNAANALTNPAASTLTANTWNVITATSGTPSAKLPTPAAGKVVGVRMSASSTVLFTLNPNASENIGPGTNSSRVMWAGESAVLVSDGTNWFKVSGMTLPMICQLSDGNVTQTGMVNSSYTDVTLGTVVVNNTGLMAAVASTVTIKRAGNYRCDAACDVTGVTANGDVIVNIRYNGTLEVPRFARMSANNGGTFMYCGSRKIANAAVGDTLKLNVRAVSGANYTTEGNQQFLTLTEEPTW